MSWGVTLGIFLNRDFELEFIFDRQRTTLEASGTEPVKVDSLEIGNYHGTLACNFGGGQGPSREVRVARCDLVPRERSACDRRMNEARTAVVRYR